MDADVIRWQAAFKILETDDLMLVHDPDEILIEEDEVPEDGPSLSLSLTFHSLCHSLSLTLSLFTLVRPLEHATTPNLKLAEFYMCGYKRVP